MWLIIFEQLGEKRMKKDLKKSFKETVNDLEVEIFSIVDFINKVRKDDDVYSKANIKALNQLFNAKFQERLSYNGLSSVKS